jgi:hypothetical protein
LLLPNDLDISYETKNEVLTCFRGFYAYIQNRFNTGIQIIRTDNGDNGTEYVNHEFGNFLSEKRIFHQTSCPDTSSQNVMKPNLL